MEGQERKRSKIDPGRGNGKALSIEARAQIEARNLLLSDTDSLNGEIEINQRIRQRVEFQESKRHENIATIVNQAALQLGNSDVPDSEVNHDWTARFFREAQDVSSDEMQAFWSRILAGEVQKTGTTSIRTLGILKDIDTATAQLFTRFCSLAIYLKDHDGNIFDCRVPSLDGDPAQNSLLEFGLDFGLLNQLNEYGLIISDYNSYFNYEIVEDHDELNVASIHHQGVNWDWDFEQENVTRKIIKLQGVAMTVAGSELSKVVPQEITREYTEALRKYLLKRFRINMRRTGVTDVTLGNSQTRV